MAKQFDCSVHSGKDKRERRREKALHLILCIVRTAINIFVVPTESLHRLARPHIKGLRLKMVRFTADFYL